MPAISPASTDRLRRDLSHLTETIGVRLAGTPGERAAADYIAEQCRAAGATVTEETFPMKSRVVQEQELALRINGEWRSFPGSLLSSSPGTDGEWLEAPVVLVEPTDYQRADLSYLRGCAVLHLGSHLESRENYRRLIEAEPAFLLMADTRYPGPVPLADGMFPEYTATIGAVPILNVAFLDLWSWLQDGADRARIRVVGGMQDAVSQNVIAELPGSDPELASELIFVSGHHDTQADSPGADDNGTGTIGVMELTRLLAPLPRRRTLRLICFGTEEQLSVGSAAYVRAHRAEIENRGQFIWNLDSYGSLAGVTRLYLSAPPEFEAAFRPFFHERDLYYQTLYTATPYQDAFPFAVADCPGLFYHRENCSGGRWFHHRPDDDMSQVSIERVAAELDAVAAFLHAMANVDSMPFPIHAPAEQRAKLDSYWTDLFGGW